jgi:hypothetical protein
MQNATRDYFGGVVVGFAGLTKPNYKPTMGGTVGVLEPSKTVDAD